MSKATPAQDAAGAKFLSLTWRVLGLLFLVLALMNISLAYLVYNRSAAQFEAEQSEKRLAQTREFRVVLSNGFEFMSTFASFIPLLSMPAGGGGADALHERVAAALSEHGLMLDVEWGIEAVHYFVGDSLDSPLVSWPPGRPAVSAKKLLQLTRRTDTPQGQIVCADTCVQVVTVPLLQYGKTAAYLVVERSIADSLREVHLLSGAEFAVLRDTDALSSDGGRHLAVWGKDVAAITHEGSVLPTLVELNSRVSLAELLQAPQRVQSGADWFEIFALPPASNHPGLELLVVNRVTDQVQAIHDATLYAIIVGLFGMLISGVTLLLVLGGPMQRIRDVVHVLPLMAEKSYVRLRYELPEYPDEDNLRDEIDVMVSAISRVSKQMQALDEAHSAAEAALRDSEQGLQLAQSMAKVASWSGQPLEGLFRVHQGWNHIDPVLEYVETWDEYVELVHPDDRSKVRIAWRQGRAGGRMDVEYRLLIDSRQIDIHAVARFDLVGPLRVLRAAGMMQDVTATRAAERSLMSHRDRLEDEVLERTAELVAARKEAERLAQNKGQFLANMSHEIRTPLNAVLGLSQIGILQSQNRAIANTFEQIIEAGEHLLNVVNDVLDMSKLEAGKLVVVAEPFDLGKTVRQCVEMLQQRAEAKALTLKLSLAGNLPQFVIGDAFRLQQILINLLSNAIKFTEHGSVTIDVQRQGGSYRFQVEDTGIGMMPDQVSRLFAPFSQFGDSAQQRNAGTGLGLSISHTLATLMGGDIRAYSVRGEGSRFLLRLPFNSAQGMDADLAQSPPGVTQGGQRLAGLRVLVADDVSINRSIARALLEMEGAQVTTVEDGLQAVAAVTAGDGAGFDLVLMDVEMPGMDGRQATRNIRAAGHELPIIGVTAHVLQAEREMSLAAGMDDQLVKPIMRDALVGVIGRWLA